MNGIAIYVLIIVSLALAGLTAMQFFYMILLEKRDREQKKRIQSLEKRCLQLAGRINRNDGRVSTDRSPDEKAEVDSDTPIEVDIWIDVLDER